MKGTFFLGLDGVFSSTFPSDPAALGLLFKSTCWKRSGHVCVPTAVSAGDQPGFLSHRSHLVRPSHLGPRKMALEAEIPSCSLIINVAYKWACGSGKHTVRQSRCPHHVGWLSSSLDSTGAVAAQFSLWVLNPPGDRTEQAAGPELPLASMHPSSPHETKRWGKREQSTSRPPWHLSAAGPSLPPQPSLPLQPPGFVKKGGEQCGKASDSLTASGIKVTGITDFLV